MFSYRTGIFTPKYVTTINRNKLTAGESYPVNVHGVFQYQDGDSAEIVILVETRFGNLYEASPNEVVMDRD